MIFYFHFFITVLLCNDIGGNNRLVWLIVIIGRIITNGISVTDIFRSLRTRLYSLRLAITLLSRSGNREELIVLVYSSSIFSSSIMNRLKWVKIIKKHFKLSKTKWCIRAWIKYLWTFMDFLWFRGFLYIRDTIYLNVYENQWIESRSWYIPELPDV